MSIRVGNHLGRESRDGSAGSPTRPRGAIPGAGETSGRGAGCSEGSGAIPAPSSGCVGQPEPPCTPGRGWHMDGHTLEMKIPNCEAFPPRMLKPSCGGKPAGKCNHQNLSLSPALLLFPRAPLRVQDPSNSPGPSSLLCFPHGSKARQQHQSLSPNSCHRQHPRAPRSHPPAAPHPKIPHGEQPTPWNLSPCSSLCQDAASREYRDPRTLFFGRNRSQAAPGRRRPPHLRPGRLLENDGAGQELRELVVVVGVINALRGTRTASAAAGPGSPALRGPAGTPGPCPRYPGLTSCGGTQAGGLS